MDLQGTQNADTLTGGADNDTIYGFAGNDTVKGLAGDDVLAGHDGNDNLQGGVGDDYILGGAGNDTIDGGAGNDWAAYEDATAGVKVDLNITGTQNTVGGGTDKLVGIENVYGSAFNDTLTGNAEANMLVGDAGNDVVSGGKGDDTMWGDAGADTLDGGDGDDYMVGGAGDDIIKGGAGVDWSSYENATAGVTVDLNKTTAQNTGGAGTDTITGVELLYGSKFDDILTGDAKDNYLWGTEGNDKLYGGAGDDHLSGGNGVNIIDGGEGFDTVDYAFSDVGVTINLSGAPAPQIPIPDGVDTIISVEAAMGSAYNDYIVGNDAENYLFGDAGDDVIFGINGNDTLDGGDGNDILRGSFRKPGDMLLGGAGDDLAIVWTGPGSEGAATTVDGGAGFDSLMFSSVSDIMLNLGNTGDQVIAPGVHMIVRNIEKVTGGYGNDHLTGDAGNNVINGGAEGDDVLDGGAGFDVVSYENSPGVRVDLSKTGPQDTKTGGLDTLINFEGVKGSSMADILIGDAKDNTLEGGSGSDILDGGAGTDTAIFWGNASDYTWTLNANGTWTVKGLGGADTLLNVEKLQFNDKTVTLSPSTTTVTVDDLIGGTKVLAVSEAGVKDAIFSADGLTAYVATADGHVKAIDTLSGQVRADIKVGTDLGGMDVSVDGRYLVVTEGKLVDRSSPGGAPAKMATVHVVDLTTGAVKNYNTFVNNQDQGFADVAFLSDGKIMLTQIFAGSGQTPLTTLDPTTGAFTRGTVMYGQNGALSVSDDHNTVLMSSTNSSPSTLFLFSAAQGHIADADMGNVFGIQAISGDGSLIAQYGAIYDRSLNHLFTLSSSFLADVHGVAFSADNQHFYIVDAAEDRIFAFSMTSGAVEEIYDIGADIKNLSPDWITGSGYGDRVTLSNDGQRMLIMDDTKVVSVNIAALKPTGGTEGADALVSDDSTGADQFLRGFGGDDQLYGSYHSDTLIGGAGADILSGGQGVDTYVFDKGDTTWALNSDAGVDTIIGWEAYDRLSFGLHTEFIHYAEQTATSWTAAATTAPQIMGSQHLSYLAMQVGADVYVFAAPNGALNGAVESVVKLTNTTLDKISGDNFIPVGDDSANILVGGALDDRIYGYGGDDTLKGGKGADALFGGKGIDTFVIDAGDSTWSDTSDAGIDVIMDWEASDKLVFGPLGTGFEVSKLPVFNWQDALVDAKQPIGAGGTAFMAYQVGADVYVFYKPNGLTTSIESAVKLANTTLDKVGVTTFIPHVGLPLDGDDNANLLTGSVLEDYINGKGGNDVINGGKGNDVLTGGAGADVFKFLPGDGLFNPKLHDFDTVTDFGSGDKLAFGGVSAVVKESEILRLVDVGPVNPNTGEISAVAQLTIQAYQNQLVIGGQSQKYVIVGAGVDTFVIADTDPLRPGYDQVVLLKNVVSSLVTADMFMAA